MFLQNLFSFIFDFGPIIFAIAGFYVAYTVFKSKKEDVPLVCPLDGHCEEVTNSRFSKFLGIRLEIMGMGYYGSVVLFYTLHLLLPSLFSDTLIFFFTAFTVASFFFSVYLVSIQAFILKQWCTWCLFSAGFSTLIFITAVFGADIELISLLTDWKPVIVVLHALAAAVGVGTATVTDVLFFKFLKDYKISKGEASLLDTLSMVIWVALGIVIVTGLGLYLPESERLLDSSKFVTKMVAVCVIAINGFVLNIVIAPRLTDIIFGEKHEHITGELRFLRKLVFSSGGISIVSWYLVFVLGSLRSIPIDLGPAILVYVSLLFFAIAGGQYYDQWLVWKKSKDGI